MAEDEDAVRNTSTDVEKTAGCLVFLVAERNTSTDVEKTVKRR